MSTDYTLKDQKRFWSKVAIGNLDECWEWQAYKSRGGRSRFRIGKKRYIPQRLVYLWTYGEIPEGMCVCHSCDNPPCCNPSHLWMGTQIENIRDMDKKGRRARNFKGGTTKLNTEDVKNIRQLILAGYNNPEIAKIIGKASRYVVSRIRCGKSFRYIVS